MLERAVDFIRRLFTIEEEPLFLSAPEENKIIKKKSWRDRRIFERIPAKLSLRFRDMQANQWALAETQDISAKGIGLVSEKEFPPKTPLEMWLPIIDKGEIFYTRGNVAWSEILGPNKYRVGVELEKPELMGISQVLRAI
jgi:hypothetical protein